METKKSSIKVYDNKKEGLPDEPEACIEIARYNSSNITWLHSSVIAETDEDGYFIRYKSTEDFRNLLGGLYCDYVKAMKELGVEIKEKGINAEVLKQSN